MSKSLALQFSIYARIIWASIIFLCSASIQASYSFIPWLPEWQPLIIGKSCWLAQRYADRAALDNPHISRDVYITFDSFSLRFIIPTETYEESNKNFIRGALYLELVSSSGEKLSNQQRRIDSAVIGEHQFKRYVDRQLYNPDTTRGFYLEGSEARSVFNALRHSEQLELTLSLDDMTDRILKIPNKHSGKFTIWADMLQACYISRVKLNP